MNERPTVAMAPLSEIPYPAIDLARGGNPVPSIIGSPEYDTAARFFQSSPALARSLISGRAQALLYALIRNLRPEHVFEIGTYRAGTSEAICRALHANGSGTLHTTDPFSPEIIHGILEQWPEELRRHVRPYHLDSMGFYEQIARERDVRPALVFVDGCHDHHFAFFDIASAARLLAPRGFLVIDNISQAGPYLAAADFRNTNPGWTECPIADYRYDPSKAFDRGRKGIPGSDFMILRAPRGPTIGERPVAFPEFVLLGRTVSGIEIVLGCPVHVGVLHAQCIARGFAAGRNPIEEIAGASITIAAGQDGERLRLQLSIEMDAAAFDQVRLEIWLSWSGKAPLPLLEAPAVY